MDSAMPAQGSYELEFALFDAPLLGNQVGPGLTNSPVWVSDGLFTVTLDFGLGAFTGDARWLRVGVHTNGSTASFTRLSPRQPVAPAPYATYAVTAEVASTWLGTLPGGQFSGLYPNPVFLTNAGNILAGNLVGNGFNVTNLSASQLLFGTMADERLSANVALLTTDAAFTGDLAALRLNIGAGHSLGGAKASIGGGQNNTNHSAYAVVGGGQNNSILTGSEHSAIAGGGNNTIYPDADYSSIGGGGGNLLQDNVNYSVVSGGYSNTVLANISHAVIPGGRDNVVGADYGFAAGRRAKASHSGAFVWADSTDADFASTAAKQFLIRAAGGVGIGTNNPASMLHVAGAVTADSLSGNGAGLSNLSADNLASGVISDARLSANVAMLNGSASFAGVVSAPGLAGGGFLISNLNASKLAFGTVPEACLSTNVAMLNAPASFRGAVTAASFNGDGSGLANVAKLNAPAAFNGPVSGSAFYGHGGGLTNLIASELKSGTLPDARLSANVALLSGSPTFAGTVTAGGDLAGARLRSGASHELGGSYTSIAGGSNNTNQGAYASVGGGYRNAIRSGATAATLGGGEFNVIDSDTESGTVGGGWQNSIQSNANYGTIGGGNGNVIQTNTSYATIPGGTQAKARLYGQQAYASGCFSAPGDAQSSLYVLRAVTTNANAIVLPLDGGTAHLVVPHDTTWTFHVQISARSSTGVAAGYEIKGVIENTAGTTAFVGSPVVTTLGTEAPAWDVSVVDDYFLSLAVLVWGEANTTVRWVATVRTTEVTF